MALVAPNFRKSRKEHTRQFLLIPCVFTSKNLEILLRNVLSLAKQIVQDLFHVLSITHNRKKCHFVKNHPISLSSIIAQLVIFKKRTQIASSAGFNRSRDIFFVFVAQKLFFPHLFIYWSKLVRKLAGFGTFELPERQKKIRNLMGIDVTSKSIIFAEKFSLFFGFTSNIGEFRWI